MATKMRTSVESAPQDPDLLITSVAVDVGERSVSDEGDVFNLEHADGKLQAKDEEIENQPESDISSVDIAEVTGGFTDINIDDINDDMETEHGKVYVVFKLDM